MISVPHRCQRRHAELEFSVKEEQSEVIFQNPFARRVHQIKVDGCVFTAQDDKRCDHLINVEETETSVFVELKGSDIEGAYEQLNTSQEQLAEHINRRVFWIISYSGKPRFNTTIQILAIRARREKKASLLVESSPYTHLLK